MKNGIEFEWALRDVHLMDCLTKKRTANFSAIPLIKKV